MSRNFHDNALDGMRSTLEMFRKELENVAKEIIRIQNESQILKCKAKKRNDVQKEVDKVLKGVVVQPDLIR
jgi:hypothetical protein